jgi:hypothetical protein
MLGVLCRSVPYARPSLFKGLCNQSPPGALQMPMVPYDQGINDLEYYGSLIRSFLFFR